MKNILQLILILILVSCNNKKTVSTLQVPGMERYCTIDVGGESIIPNGRVVKPYGEFIRIHPDPFGMALSPDGTLALSVHNNLLTLINTGDKSTRECTAAFQGKGSYMGAAIKKDNRTAWLSGGDNGDIIVLDLLSLESKKRITINGICDGHNYMDSFAGDIRLSDD